jgi:hypothetical protein
LEIVIFCDFGATIMAFIKGNTNARSKPDVIDPFALSPIVIVFLTANDNRKAMDSDACTFMSKLEGLCT